MHRSTHDTNLCCVLDQKMGEVARKKHRNDNRTGQEHMKLTHVLEIMGTQDSHTVEECKGVTAIPLLGVSSADL